MSDRLSPTEQAIQNRQRGGTMYGNGQTANTPAVKDDLWDDLPEETQKAIVEQGQAALITVDNLIIGGMRFTQTGLVQVEELTEAGLQLVGDVLYRFKGSFQWLMGDWLNSAGIYTWADVERVANLFRVKVKTLQNWKSVSANVPHSLRKEQLDFFHHLIVAYMPEDQQRYWLDRAALGDEIPEKPGERQRWSTGRLRREIEKSQKVETITKDDPPPLLDKKNKRRMDRIWRNINAGTYDKIHEDDFYYVRSWLDNAEKEMKKKPNSQQK